MALPPDPVEAALVAALRADRGRILAALIARLGDFDRAEDALQEAAASALEHWGRAGVPVRPDAWLIRVAFRKAIDRLRRGARDAAGGAALAVLARDEAEDPDMIADERLRLIFTCCHPALDAKSRVALTLRTVCGLTTGDIARAFLDREATMGQRLSRAKARIAATGIGFRVPDREEWDDRLNSVLTVIYLIFTAGYDAPGQDGADLCEEAIFLGRLMDNLRPGEAEIEGLLALLLLTHARRAARVDGRGASLPPAAQDQSRWDWAMTGEGLSILMGAMGRDRPGPFQIKAAIAACHGAPTGPDWPEIARLYERLLDHEPTPVVRLNRAVALSACGAGAEALAELHRIGEALADYQPYFAALADVSRQMGDRGAALAAYDRAIALATRPEDAAFLCDRREKLLRNFADAEK